MCMDIHTHLLFVCFFGLDVYRYSEALSTARKAISCIQDFSPLPHPCQDLFGFPFDFFPFYFFA